MDILIQAIIIVLSVVVFCAILGTAFVLAIFSIINHYDQSADEGGEI